MNRSGVISATFLDSRLRCRMGLTSIRLQYYFLTVTSVHASTARPSHYDAAMSRRQASHMHSTCAVRLVEMAAPRVSRGS